MIFSQDTLLNVKHNILGAKSFGKICREMYKFSAPLCNMTALLLVEFRKKLEANSLYVQHTWRIKLILIKAIKKLQLRAGLQNHQKLGNSST